MNFNRKALRWTSMTALTLLLAGLALIPFEDLTQLDPLTNIRHIGTNNDQLNAVNDRIVGRMQNISDLAETTQQIDAHLHTLQKGLDGPATSLGHLDQLSQREVDLSKQFVGLATHLQTNLTSINSSSTGQQTTIQSMNDTTALLAASANQLAATNDTMADKLDQAAVLTKQVEQSMP
ncbi:hypothetical protein JJB07_01365 [Tumebacillus sp. ITR2]|uniref:Methyl-accepting chemotaxis protein n=1 Tax=Tumebacillus amylolyticus TaxID=2801339 RepID=A0ABS1J4T1_9BACL|nr:hypothetical protein [Tumebacillus amylolyticus]MBL0385281.1 hypothetical protein [Tumebacillus amylolyticus]